MPARLAVLGTFSRETVGCPRLFSTCSSGVSSPQLRCVGLLGSVSHGDIPPLRSRLEPTDHTRSMSGVDWRAPLVWLWGSNSLVLGGAAAGADEGHLLAANGCAADQCHGGRHAHGHRRAVQPYHQPRHQDRRLLYVRRGASPQRLVSLSPRRMHRVQAGWATTRRKRVDACASLKLAAAPGSPTAMMKRKSPSNVKQLAVLHLSRHKDSCLVVLFALINRPTSQTFIVLRYLRAPVSRGEERTNTCHVAG